ncbi:MAG: DUF2062 domain-containing protein [Shewanella sp.]|nr:DUF2062 domain-containing protein [Shewanella sp.]MCF1430613.1 DUF2062 domain-containing protein [Shewanella sp.]MCF1437965.1 DUF2062 domain-containing protein [Shewanella sp.]MCF1456686.1 DUF2062 domain-containing protein [Shewanella sp.]
MPKKLLERYIPKPETLKQHKHLKMFGALLHNNNLWVLNRKSVPGAFAVGLFTAWIPIPLQMILAGALAIIFKVNVPISVTLVWITNPLTIPVMFYVAYWLGASLLGVDVNHFEFEASWAWIKASLTTIGPSFLLGCSVMAISWSAAGYFVLRNLWKYATLMKWQRRSHR